jgi:hypothetical protein
MEDDALIHGEPKRRFEFQVSGFRKSQLLAESCSSAWCSGMKAVLAF